MSALSSRIGKSWIYLSTVLSAVTIFTVITVLLIESGPAVTEVGWNLFSLQWHPPTGEFGILSMLYGTVFVTLIALTIAIPIGFLTAVYTAEFLSGRTRIIVKSLLELLAGIPSIIYGLIGIAFFSVWIGNWFDLQSGRTILTAGILLAIMVLPTLITLIDDALTQVPKSYREAALGLGLFRYEVIKDVLLPIAKSDIIGAILLGLGRVLGETMAVMLVIGSIDRIPQPIINFLSAGQTITSKLGREIAESSFGSTHFSVMVFMGFILLVMVILLTVLAQSQFKTNSRLYE